MDKSTYSKIEKGLWKVTVAELQKMAGLLNTTIDQIVNYDGNMPAEVVIEDKTAIEQMHLIQQLEEDDKQTIFRLMIKCLPTKNLRTSSRKIWPPCKNPMRLISYDLVYRHVKPVFQNNQD